MVVMACKHSFNHPLKWAGVELDIDDFAPILTPELILKYKMKDEEARTRYKLRMYCGHPTANSDEACGTFLGNRLETYEDVCYGSCALPSCRHGIPRIPGALHNCDAHPAINPTAHLDPAVRGVQWQSCPHTDCGRPVELSEICNHMTCPLHACKTDFCFLCGMRVDMSRNRLHWSRDGICPQYRRGLASPAGLTEWSDARELFAEAVRRRVREERMREGNARERMPEINEEQGRDDIGNDGGSELMQHTPEAGDLSSSWTPYAATRTDPVRA